MHPDVTKWIQKMNAGKGPRKGGLHSALHIPQGKKIPKAKVAKAAKRGGKIGKMANLAQTFAKMRKR